MHANRSPLDYSNDRSSSVRHFVSERRGTKAEGSPLSAASAGSPWWAHSQTPEAATMYSIRPSYPNDLSYSSTYPRDRPYSNGTVFSPAGSAYLPRGHSAAAAAAAIAGARGSEVKVKRGRGRGRRRGTQKFFGGGHEVNGSLDGMESEGGVWKIRGRTGYYHHHEEAHSPARSTASLIHHADHRTKPYPTHDVTDLSPRRRPGELLEAGAQRRSLTGSMVDISPHRRSQNKGLLEVSPHPRSLHEGELLNVNHRSSAYNGNHMDLSPRRRHMNDDHLLTVNPHRRPKVPNLTRERSPLNYPRESSIYTVPNMAALAKDLDNRAEDVMPVLLPEGVLVPLAPLDTGQGSDGGVDGSGLPLVPQELCMPTTARPSPNCKDTDLCLICGDRASGYHYNALSCEGCKGFFRRSITRQAKYACKYGGRCELDMWMRRRCQACRLRRCRDVGMREECLLSDKQCLARNARRQTKRRSSSERGGRHSSAHRSKARDSTGGEVDGEPGLEEGEGCEREGCSQSNMEKILESLCDGHQAVVKCLVSYQDKYELPSEADLAMLSKMKVNEEQEPADMSDAIFMHMVEMTILVTRLVINFAKSLPGFVSLQKEDQVILLKGSASEVMMLRTARRYDPETDTVVFGNGTPFSANAMEFGGLQGYIDSMFDFSRGMSRLMIDDAEYALLTALSIFSVRPGLSDVSAVEQIQDIYLEVLLAYLNHRRVGSRSYLPRLLMKLVELRSLSSEHASVLRNLKLEKKSLPPLISEYFNISE